MQTPGRDRRARPAAPLRRSLPMAALCLLIGCAGPAPYDAPRFSFRAAYDGAGATAPVLLVNDDWWRALKDPVLDDLVTRALAGNLSLALATERVVQAQATARTVPSDASLTSGAALRREGGDDVADIDTAEATLGFDWLLDPYGGRKSERSAAAARVEVAEAEVSAARLLVLLELGRAYVDLRHAQRLLAIRGEDLARRKKTLALTQSFLDARDATRIDIVRAEAQVAQIETQIPALRARVRNGKAVIAVLAGATPGTLPVDLDARPRQPAPRLSPQVGIPADLLRNRPDIRVAERDYAAAVGDLGAARADLYPKLSLGGAITLASVRGTAGTEYYFGPSLAFPALPDGAARGRADARASVARQAQITWKSTVLDAILEVESALADYAAARQSAGAAARTVELRREALRLTEDLVARDGATLRDLIDAEDDIAEAETALADTLRQTGQGFVTLNVTLGSGSSLAVQAEP